MDRDDNLFIEGDLARCVSALRGLTGLLRAAGASNDRGVVDLEDVGDLLDIVADEADATQYWVGQALFPKQP